MQAPIRRILTHAQKRLIIHVAAAQFDLAPDLLLMQYRQAVVCQARWVAQDMLYRRGLTQSEIARVFGLRDHTPVIHGLRRVRTNPYLITQVRAAEIMLREMGRETRDIAVPA